MFEKGDFMETIRNMEINQLHDFRNHPFKVEVNTELCELMKSIEKEGVLVPLLVRTKVLLAAAKMAEKIVDVVYEKVVEKEVPVLLKTRFLILLRTVLAIEWLRQESTITNSNTEKLILDHIQRDLCIISQ